MTEPVMNFRPRRFTRRYATFMDRRNKQMEKMEKILARMIADWIKQYIGAGGRDFKNIHLADMIGKESQNDIKLMCEQCYDATMSQIEYLLAAKVNRELHKMKLHERVRVSQSGIFWGIRPHLHIENIQTT